MRNDHCHVWSKEPCGPCWVNCDVSFGVFAEKKINFDQNNDMAWVEHKKTFSCFKFVVESEDPTDKGKKGHCFLKRWRELFFDSVSKVMFPLEEEDKKYERQYNDKGSVVKERNFLVASKTAIFWNFGFKNSSNHVFVQSVKKRIDFHEFIGWVVNKEGNESSVFEFIKLNSVIIYWGGLQYWILILC